MRLCVAVGLPQHEVEERWTAEEFDELYDAWLDNQLDPDGTMSAGTMISWLLMPHYGKEAQLPPPEKWRCYMPQAQPPDTLGPNDEKIGQALKGSYHG